MPADVTVVAQVPLKRPLEEAAKLEYPELIREIEELSGVAARIGQSQDAKVTMCINGDARIMTNAGQMPVQMGFSTRSYDYLHIEARAVVDTHMYENEGMEPLHALTHARQDTASDIRKFIGDLAVACTIARPGTFDSGTASIYAEGQTDSAPGNDGHFFAASVAEAKAYSWPPLQHVTLRDTWSWMTRLNGFHTGIVQGPSGRALAALSYQLRESTQLRFTWSLLGLEALYGRGNVALKDQLVLLQNRNCSWERRSLIRNEWVRCMISDHDLSMEM